ncbi:iron ABC transporter permease [Pseudonocardia nematodicida]|uniref:Iron ABC transporter permease n=1 Tax=Pseudonocardia nematodicida TaxID=1206997 RepID=A0ABV1K4Y1_9PSEU
MLLRRRPRRGSGGAAPVLVAGAALAGLVMLTPLIYLAVRSVERGPAYAADVLTRPRTGFLFWNTVVLTGAATAVCAVVGTLAAWLVVRTDLPGRRLWGILFALPLAVPSYVAGFGWISRYPGLAGFAGTLLVLSSVSFPYVFLTVSAALSRGDAGTEEAARSLGLGPLRVLLTVTLRRVWPAVLAGALLVALSVISDFGVPSLMRYETFTLGIFTRYRSTFDPTPAAILGVALVALAAVVLVAEARARGRSAARVGRGAGRRAGPTPLGRWTPAGLVIVLAVVGVSLGVPAHSLASWTIAGASAGVDWPHLAATTLDTFRVALLGAVCTLVLAIPVGVLAARHRGRLVRALENVTYLGFALPGVTVGLALVYLGIRVLPDLYQRTPMLIAGYAVLFLPLAVGAVRTGVADAPVQLEEASRSLGRGRLTTLARVTVPLAAPGIAAGGALVFLSVARELPATLMLRPTGTETLAMAIWTRTGASQFAAAAPYAVVLVLLAAVPTLVLDRVLRRRGGD